MVSHPDRPQSNHAYLTVLQYYNMHAGISHITQENNLISDPSKSTSVFRTLAIHTKYCDVKITHAIKLCVKKMFGYMRSDSMTGVLLELSLPAFDTVIHNSRIIFANQVTMSHNNIVQWFLSIGVL